MLGQTSPTRPSPLSHASPTQRGVNFRRDQQPHMPGSPSAARPLRPVNGMPGSSPALGSPKPAANARVAHDGRDPLSRLPPAQLHEMRESFQVLDRDNDGVVTRDDVVDMLAQIGQDPSLIQNFPAQTNLASYLSDLATALLPLSSPDELLAAFAAFDSDDSGQIDVAELRNALLHTAPEPGQRKLDAHELDGILEDFSARRAFKRGLSANGPAARGSVFRYEDFVGSLGGKSKENKAEA